MRISDWSSDVCSSDLVVRPDELVANLSEADVRAKLSVAGYTNVHDVDYEDGIWNAEADDLAGKDVELKIDPDNGAVMGKEKDRSANCAGTYGAGSTQRTREASGLPRCVARVEKMPRRSRASAVQRAGRLVGQLLLARVAT